MAVHRRVLWGGWLLLLLLGGGMAGAAAAAAPLPVWYFVTEPFPPYTYAENGRAAGPLADVLRAVCARLQRDCRIEVLPWRRALQQAENGQVDGIFGFVDTPQRRKLFHISAPVLDARYTFFGRAGTDFVYSGAASLAGHTVGVYGPSGGSLVLDELLRKQAGVEVVLEPDNPTVLRKLLAGRYGEQGLILINESQALLLMRELPQAGSLQAAGVARSFSYSFGLSRQRVSRLQFEAFNQALTALCRSGRSAALIKPYALPASACAKS